MLDTTEVLTLRYLFNSHYPDGCSISFRDPIVSAVMPPNTSVQWYSQQFGRQLYQQGLSWQDLISPCESDLSELY